MPDVVAHAWGDLVWQTYVIVGIGSTEGPLARIELNLNNSFGCVGFCSTQASILVRC